jgi:PucR C-terminal helix-turn-helix domain
MATLGDLRRELFPSAVAIDGHGSAPGDRAGAAARGRTATDTGSEAAAGRLVGWVRVLKARVPAFDALEAGDLAIVPATALAVVAPGRAEMTALADALVRARVSGVVILGADGAAAARAADAASAARTARPAAGATAGGAAAAATPGVAPRAGEADGVDPAGTGVSLGDSLASAGVPTYVLAGSEPGTLERAIIGYLVNRRAELDRQASLLEARLERLAIGASDLPALLTAIGAFLGRAVALEGPRGDHIAVQAPAGVADAAAAVAGYLARSRAARSRVVALRVPLPAGADGTVSPGALVLLGERPPSELERVVAERIAGLVALEMIRTESVRRARDDARRPEVLPADGPPWVVLVARQVVPGAAVVELAQREEIRREIRRFAPARRMGLRGDAASLELRVVLVADPGDPGGPAVGERIASFLGRPVGVSRPFIDASDRPAAEAEARATLEAAETLPRRPSIARADRLPAYRLLGNLHNLPDGARQARALLEPLFAGSPTVVRGRFATLRAVLEQPGLADAAAALGVHRNTIAYRVRRIEALTGWRLDDPELRFPLALALRFVQEEQGDGP